ncbi:short chain dehydrogenase [Aestuariispira insulae]|uniref:NAD(P)-dependent dehydrogenase (Short-subunit alcohol dehydrogenase family) n=1 Tax=Aestuariispira insulae TaxID=1461337 RepID=A0A3D9H520_9PROT|nr:short chain dehydrogenase [Aestuariispira insulae]RED44271.1 NAD(P)-dependent dehydrogenase (short-subunit alcohol dehydrogenase family) [Aestuariispira insulae]
MSKKIVVVGASGTLGRAITGNLEKDHEVIRAGRSGSDLILDASNLEQLQTAFSELGSIDALVSCIGTVPFTPFMDTAPEDFNQGLLNKFGHQANLVRAALPRLSAGGSITLTSGILADEPLVRASCAASANMALHGFTMAIAAEQLGKARINCISPSVVEDSVEKYGSFFDGFPVTMMPDLITAYRRSIFGPITGKVIRC